MLRHEIPNALFERLDTVEPYPDNVAPITTMIDRTAFFPGGKGLWLENKSDIFPSVLVLGQDFSTLKDYLEILSGDTNDLDCPTWRNLIKLFVQAGINLDECFFSNVFMGLRRTESNVGRFPGFKDKEFIKRNIEFLSFQVEVIKPKLIITLGKFSPAILGNLSSEDLLTWKTAKAFNDIEEPIKFNVKIGSHQCNCVALVHPSMRHLNIKQRHYKNYIGNDAELNMLKDAQKTT